MDIRENETGKTSEKTIKNTPEKAAEKAAAYINIKPRTAFQVRKYLRDKGYEDDVISSVINQLEEYHYIDDMEYAMMYFRYGFEKGRGILRIKRELSEKGVSSDVIEMAYEELEDVPDQNESAMQIAQSMISGMNIEDLEYEEKRKLQAKIGRRLISRGFSSDVVYRVINRLL